MVYLKYEAIADLYVWIDVCTWLRDRVRCLLVRWQEKKRQWRERGKVEVCHLENQ